MTRVRFVKEGIEVEVSPGMTLLEAARACGAHMGSACGGNCACSTCHVFVVTGLASLAEPSDEENDILDKAFDVRATSRLGCQVRVGESAIDLEITRESRQAFLDEHPDER